MPDLGRYARELRARLWKPPVHEEVRDELDAHLEMLEQDLVRQGVPPDAARAAARAKFGDVTRIAADCRDIGETRDRERRVARALDGLLQDVRTAVTQLRLNPRFAVVATLTLAIGLGAAATIFGIADAVLLRPLPFRDPARLVLATSTSPAGQAFSISEPDYIDWRARVTTLAGLGAFSVRAPTLRTERGPEQLTGTAATSQLFAVLGVAPALGRTF